MRKVSSLVGGGAGSLNDWSPTYLSMEENAWYGEVYHLLFNFYIKAAWQNRKGDKYLVTLLQSLKLEKVKYLNCISCNACNHHFTVSATFERFLALYMLKKHLIKTDKKLVDWLTKEASIFSTSTKYFRKLLNESLVRRKIQIHPFESNCVQCSAERNYTRYRISVKYSDGSFSLRKLKDI